MGARSTSSGWRCVAGARHCHCHGFGQNLSKSVRIAWRSEKCMAVRCLGVPVDCTGDRHCSRSERFEDDHAEGLPAERGQADHIGRRHEDPLLVIVDDPQPASMLRFGELRPQRLGLWTGPGDDEVDV